MIGVCVIGGTVLIGIGAVLYAFGWEVGYGRGREQGKQELWERIKQVGEN